MKSNTVVVDIAKEIYNNIKRFVTKYKLIIIALLYLCFVIYSILKCNETNKKQYIIGLVIIFVLLNLFYYLIDKVEKVKSKNENKIPLLGKRLTFKIEDQINVMKEDWPIAVLYLSDLEDYLERCGLL